jgi:hypothetical protein
VSENLQFRTLNLHLRSRPDLCTHAVTKHCISKQTNITGTILKCCLRKKQTKQFFKALKIRYLFIKTLGEKILCFSFDTSDLFSLFGAYKLQCWTLTLWSYCLASAYVYICLTFYLLCFSNKTKSHFKIPYIIPNYKRQFV